MTFVERCRSGGEHPRGHAPTASHLVIIYIGDCVGFLAGEILLSSNGTYLVNQKSSWLSNAATAVMLMCAISVVAIMVRREFFPPAPPRGTAPAASQRVADFASIASVGHRFGPPSAPVTIVEFADFECPVCRHFETKSLLPIRKVFQGQVAVVFRHWPLSYHRFALPSARAAECASAQGRFESFHDLLYAKQDSLGLKSFTSFALESGVPDTAAFIRCNSTSTTVPAIDVDVAVAKKLKMFGTPSLIINGVLLGITPDSAALDSLIRSDLRAGGSH